MISGQILDDKELLKVNNLLSYNDISNLNKNYLISYFDNISTLEIDPFIIEENMVPFIFKSSNYCYVKNNTNQLLHFLPLDSNSYTPVETNEIKSLNFSSSSTILCTFGKKLTQNYPSLGDTVVLDGVECSVIYRNTSPNIYICIDKNYDLDYYYPFQKNGISYGWNYGKIDRQLISDSLNYPADTDASFQLANLIMENGCESLIPGEPTIWDALKQFRQNHSNLWYIENSCYSNFTNAYALNIENVEYWTGYVQVSSGSSTYGDMVSCVTPTLYNGNPSLGYNCPSNWRQDLTTPRKVRLVRLATDKDFLTAS